MDPELGAGPDIAVSRKHIHRVFVVHHGASALSAPLGRPQSPGASRFSGSRRSARDEGFWCRKERDLTDGAAPLGLLIGTSGIHDSRLSKDALSSHQLTN